MTEVRVKERVERVVRIRLQKREMRVPCRRLHSSGVNGSRDINCP